jgi:hypothetical protein
MSRPLLRQYAELSPADFDQAPVWIGCHTADYDEPWYDDTDEETFRPWTGPLPASPDVGMLLVRAEFTLHDGTRFGGFVTPVFDDEPADRDLRLSTQQPAIFAPNRILQFWCGGIEPSAARIADTYRALDRQPDRVFPIAFRAMPGLTTGNTEGMILGFHWMTDQTDIRVRT